MQETPSRLQESAADKPKGEAGAAVTMTGEDGLNMNKHCEVIRDLLPLYADDVCSVASRNIIEEHLRECPECSAMLEKLRNDEIEEGLAEEKDQVISRQARQFRRRSTAVGSVISGLFMIPILICLVINLVSGASLNGFLIVLGGMAVAASLIIVPLMVPEDKLFWTFCAFVLSVLLLLAICCFSARGTWFFTAASAVLFGMSVVFLPFLLKARPVRRMIGSFSRWLIVISVDVILFANMLNMISLYSKSIFKTGSVLALCAAGAWLLVSAIKTKRGETNE